MKVLKMLVALSLLTLYLSSAMAVDSYRSYLYSTTDEGTLDVAAPQAFIPGKVYGSKQLGVQLGSPEDLLFDKEGNLYICDAKANAIYVFSPELKHIRTIDEFDNMGNMDRFSSPSGICLDEDNNLYVADYGRQRVVELSQDARALMIIENPQAEILGKSFVFQPQKVLADKTNRIFVLSKNTGEGMLQFTKTGSFLGFFGSNTVSAGIFDRIWKWIMTEEQSSKLTQFVPVEYTNFSLDDKGFIYAVTKVSDVNHPIRRLNLFGGDVLVRQPIDGSKQVVGDVSYPYAGVSGITGPSSFVDIASDSLGNYYALDDKRGRVFSYDEEGNLLCVFGSLSSGQTGSFESPSAICCHDGKVYALDRSTAELIVFEPTEYWTTMMKAMEAYYEQDFEKSLELWEKIISRNINFDLAYYKAGFCLYRLGQYEKAMEYYKLVNAREAYSDSSAKLNRLNLNRDFAYIALSAAVCALAFVVISVIRRRRRGKFDRGSV
ncbi:MAG: tetratricopeptide repeat protein [Clostridia bacterium]|nr:tetratricopeptide repeat protein [Clostridia bacterium]